MQDPDDPHILLDPSAPELIEQALRRQEGYLSATGVLCSASGERAGPSPDDRFIVAESSTRELIDWQRGIQPFEADAFDALWERVEQAVTPQEHFVMHLEAGANRDLALPFKFISTSAWHCLFAQNLYFQPEPFNSKGKALWSVLHAPDFICAPGRDGTASDAAAIIHFGQRKILLAGLRFSGEIRSALFTVQRFLLAEKNVLLIHGAVGTGANSQAYLRLAPEAPGRALAWGKERLFDLEQGLSIAACDLSKSGIAAGFGAVAENIEHDGATRVADYGSTHFGHYGAIVCAQPAAKTKTKAPAAVILLLPDDARVLPPLARISAQSATKLYLLAALERPNHNAPPPGALRALTEVLQKRLEKTAAVYLINTAVMNDAQLQSVTCAIESGAFETADFEPFLPLKTFGISVPRHSIKALAGLSPHPEKSASAPGEYRERVEQLESRLARKSF